MPPREPDVPDRLTVMQTARPPFIPDNTEATTIIIDYPPGDLGAPPHRHPGPAFGYVLEGEMVFEIEGEAPQMLYAGDTFWEPGGDVIHYQDGNASDVNRLRFLVTLLCPPGAPMLTLVDDKELAARKNLRSPQPS